MAGHYLAFAVQTERNTPDASPVYQFYPVKGDIMPSVELKDSPPGEYRNIHSSQGESPTDTRVSTSWKYSLPGRVYPGAELKTLLLYLFGTRWDYSDIAAPNTAAVRSIFATANYPYGENEDLSNQAISIIPNIAMLNRLPVSQLFIGGRPYSLELSFKGGESATMKMDFSGGPWIGAAGEDAIAGVDFPPASPFPSTAKLYLGGTPVVTMDGDNLENFTVGTALQAMPDELTVKIESGLEDAWRLNGEPGPSVTERKSPWKISMEFTHDFGDPAAGFSTYQEWVSQFSEPQFLPVVLTLDSTTIVPGCTTQPYHLGIFIPAAKITLAQPEINYEGRKPKIKVSIESRSDAGHLHCAYLKLITE